MENIKLMDEHINIDKTILSVNSTSLSTLASQINSEHKKCEDSLRAGLAHAMRVGELLIKAKTAADHGDWSAWIDANCEFSQRLAQKYMRVARQLPKLEEKLGANAPRVADLSFRQALYAVANNSQKIAKLPSEKQIEVLDCWDDNACKSALHATILFQRQDSQQQLKAFSERSWDQGDIAFVKRKASWAGEHFQELSEKVCDRPEIQEHQKEIDRLDAQFQELSKQLAKIESAIHKATSRYDDAVHQIIQDEYGQVVKAENLGFVTITTERQAQLNECGHDDETRKELMYFWAGGCGMCGLRMTEDDYQHNDEGLVKMYCRWCLKHRNETHCGWDGRTLTSDEEKAEGLCQDCVGDSGFSATPTPATAEEAEALQLKLNVMLGQTTAHALGKG